MDLVKILSQLDLKQNQDRSTSGTIDFQQSLNTIGGIRPDGRRLLGRSMTTTASPSSPVTATPGISSFFSESSDDMPFEIPDTFHQHRKLDRSVSEPYSSLLLPRGGSTQTGSCSSNSSSRYKTELCRPYEENGSCKYGEKCQFAHGRLELRTVARHPKYKTDLCKTYHTTGLCPYGKRCHFIHNDEERCLNLFNRYLLQQQMKDTLIEKAQLVQQQKIIAAALAAQKALHQQQQLQQNGGQKPTVGQISTDALSSSTSSIEQQRLQFPLNLTDLISSSLSDSSSLTDSPTPSPTFSMFSEDPAGALLSTSNFASVLQTQNYGAPELNHSETKLLQLALQQQHLQQTDATENNQQANLLLLMSKFQQQNMDAILNYLKKKSIQTSASSSAPCSATSSPSLASSIYSNSTNLISPYSPAVNISGINLTTTQENNTFLSFPYSAVEL